MWIKKTFRQFGLWFLLIFVENTDEKIRETKIIKEVRNQRERKYIYTISERKTLTDSARCFFC
jgi:hypothetical protein